MDEFKNHEIENQVNDVPSVIEAPKLVRTKKSDEETELKKVSNKKTSKELTDNAVDSMLIENLVECEEKSTWGNVSKDNMFKTNFLAQTSEIKFNPKRSESRVKIPFTEEEQAYLIRKVEEHGDNWKLILMTGLNEKIFNPERRTIDLKIKMDLIRKNTSYHRAAFRTWDLISINGEEIYASENKRYHEFEKFPSTAVKKFASLPVLDHLKNFIVTVVDRKVSFVSHTYKVDVIVTATGKKHKIRKAKNEEE
ncbi:hypothetical protein HERIO_2331 [Hepatospora eriocheir]|uniref:Myb-like domain-containing protein n=1 Tax=Hepatospora eriocheir TaxID=1081669 RepID=A0A1X0Q7B7_9MICR|nr:hypothetical protein HERIO_2331 [Hepatospora eriocheir]